MEQNVNNAAVDVVENTVEEVTKTVSLSGLTAGIIVVGVGAIVGLAVKKALAKNNDKADGTKKKLFWKRNKDVETKESDIIDVEPEEETE